MNQFEAKTPLVVAVVLTWNDVEMASGCVASLEAGDYDNLKIVVVDNGSDEPCGERIRERHPAIDLVVLSRNQGYTGGCNRGLERALALGADYVHLFNNDILVDPHAVTALVDALEARPEIGVASPLMFHGGPGEKIVQFYRGTLSREVGRHNHLEHDVPHTSREWPDVESPFVPTCATMFRAKVLREVGLFDEAFCTCWEDFDLCLRIEDAGWPIFTIGSAHVVHLGSITTGRTSPYITYYTTRNRLMCLARYNSSATLARNAPTIARSFWWQVKRYGLTNVACHREFAKAFLHFAQGVRGEGGGLRTNRANAG